MPPWLRDRPAQLLLAGVLGLVLLIVLFLALTGGSSTETTTRLPTGLASGLPTTSPSPSPTATVPPILLFSGRDPFQPQFFVPSASPSSTSSFSPTPSFSFSPLPSGSGSPTPSATGSGGGSGGGSSTVVSGHTVQLDDIFRASDGTKKAQVEVDGTVYTVAPGQTFAGNFKLVSFSGDPCGNFVFGDSPFQLCEAGGK